ncbi:RNA-binding protein She2p protein [Dioscorea alata]|uniref:RNA-binding protein She2p protein n=1 Tax=Dioscorea alata TaxID=55571 RepID=A0ACB7VLA0_DIOAL|nr:RNA-binding protein She2p protein [Dioscorea alata]
MLIFEIQPIHFVVESFVILVMYSQYRCQPPKGDENCSTFHLFHLTLTCTSSSHINCNSIPNILSADHF